MGLLDKAAKFAATAKDQFEELRDARNEAAVQPVAPPLPGDHDEQVRRHAMASGAPDPNTLLSRAEASHIVGVELGDARLLYDDSTIGIEYAAAGRRGDSWSVAVSAWHGDGNGFDPVEQYAFITEHVEGGAVEQLGQRALWDGSRLFVLAAPLLFHAEVTTPDSDERRAEAIAVARRVLARMEA